MRAKMPPKGKDTFKSSSLPSSSSIFGGGADFLSGPRVENGWLIAHSSLNAGGPVPRAPTWSIAKRAPGAAAEAYLQTQT